MRCELGPRHPLRLLFRGAVEQVFLTDVGICDMRLTDYLSQLLTEFIHVDDVYRLRRVDGAAIRELSRMRSAACLGPDIDEHARRRSVNRYIGDFTLFWAGVFPEQLRPRQQGADLLDRYMLEGKRSYEIASELSQPDEEPPAALLRKLSEQFESCVHGLQLVRSTWDEHGSEHHHN